MKKLLKNIYIFFLLLGIVLLVFIFSDVIFKYIIHGKSFYQVYLGDKKYKKGNYQEAVEYYNKALKLYPKHIKARYNLANIYANFEDYKSAVREYNKALKYDPGYLNARISLGIVLAENFLEFDKAIEEYKKVVKTKSHFIKIPFLYNNTKQIIEAKATAYYDMGLAYRNKSMLYTEDTSKYKNLLSKAADCYEKSLVLNPANYDAQYNLALTKHLLGFYTEALTDYCKALLISPLDYEAHYNLAILLREKRMYKDSFEEFKNAGELMNYAGNSYKAARIYSMLSEVSQMAIAEYGYKPKDVLEKLGNSVETQGYQSKNEFISAEEMGKVLKKEIKTKSVCKNYLKRF